MQSAVSEEQYILNMRGAFMRHRKAFDSSTHSNARERMEKLDVLRDVVLESAEMIADAVNRDFGFRSSHETMLIDVLPTVSTIKYCRRNLKKWMRPRSRRAGLMLMPARVRVEYQPLGVVGIIAPWNFPLVLSVGPLAYAIAAGNRAMLKMSPRTPAFNGVLTSIISEVFYEDEVTLFEGGMAASKAFASMPFDHLLFTGSTKTGREIMSAAARNLTPVTLELGGKSPVIIDENIPMKTAAERMLWGKSMNAGQVCTSPDYVLVPEARVESFVEEYGKRYARLYPGGQDVTCLVDEEQLLRIEGFLEDAREKGAIIVRAGDDPVDKRAISTRLILNVRDDMALMKEEIFGPLLPIIPYERIEDAITYVRLRPRPLALYVMSLDKSVVRHVLNGTVSGGVAVNDTVMQFVADDAPFGGVGHSGMGRYHGREGFLTFSNARTVLTRGGFFNMGRLVHPPYGGIFQRFIQYLFQR